MNDQIFWEDAVASIVKQYPYSIRLESQLLSDYDRLNATNIPMLITDGIGLDSKKQTLREERELFGEFQIYIHARTQSDMNRLLDII